MIESLPIHLRERTRVHQGKIDGPFLGADAFVLYWMRTAVRADENPALDVARWIADRKGCALLIYHAISEHYEYASDRHHSFMIQGARDVQAQFSDLGISYAFHLATQNDRQPHLVALAITASVVVTEDMPVDPPRRFLKALARKAQTPIVCVDTACIAPMQLVGKAYTRAFKFRSATKQLYHERLTRAWPQLDLETGLYNTERLPFEPIDLQKADIGKLIARAAINHAVGPVVDTIGGSSAGYRRWNAFKQKRLGQYAELRNHILLDGPSRMSPYLHYGMVSPFRIAREAAEANNEGSCKYLDELLVWRELAYTFCFYRDDHDQWSAIPGWAQETLQRHSSDSRKEIYSWEQLSRGKTKDEMWNLAQQSLLKQGELHNNCRMTWGKAVLNWKRSPQEALATLIDLNHRYALDGRDPASYGGILWCLGQFDRSFEPEQRIIGTVRSRPTSQHAARIDLDKYRTKVASPRFQPVPHVAVIGAGISGLFAARTLRDHGLNVTVFEKSRGVGGRMATRRVSSSEFQSFGESPAEGTTTADITFDHGAQYFTVRDPRFKLFVNSWIEQGLVARWPDQGRGSDQKIVVLANGQVRSVSDSEERFVAVPGMNSICKHLASDLKIVGQTRVSKISSTEGLVELLDENGDSLGVFDRLVVSAPAAQSAELLAAFPAVVAPIAKIEMKPCWAVMFAFEKPLTNQWVGAFVHDSFLSWAARNGTKPGRNSNIEQLILHAHADWTARHWEDGGDTIAEKMLAEFWRAAGVEPLPPIFLRAHRWKYAIPADPAKPSCVSDDSAVISYCGDWASGSRVEGAFLSGMSAAGRILRTLQPV